VAGFGSGASYACLSSNNLRTLGQHSGKDPGRLHTVAQTTCGNVLPSCCLCIPLVLTLAAPGDGTACQPLHAALTSCKEQVLDQMAAIGTASGKLLPLLAYARELHAASNKSSMPLQLTVDAEGNADQAEVLADAEARARQRIAETGSTLGQLQALSAVLKAV
jgi:hypothetical protein